MEPNLPKKALAWSIGETPTEENLFKVKKY